ncbi:MAG: hypothetical protein HY675_09305 [Chloroflexi bacterium]|nr:hypothetical protein [Chloroflexota bacterium]
MRWSLAREAGDGVVHTKRAQDEPNRLIREFLNPKRVPTEQEIRRILDHVAQAPFSSRLVAVDHAVRGRLFQGRTLGDREPSIIAHLAKRALVEHDWAEDVTPKEYVDHLRAVTNDPALRKAVYVRRDKRLFMGLLAPNKIPVALLGRNQSAFLWIVYSADYGTIVTGYQVRGIEEITLPKDVRWL